MKNYPSPGALGTVLQKNFGEKIQHEGIQVIGWTNNFYGTKIAP